MKSVRTCDYGTHKNSEIFTLTDYFCPHCGVKNVWEGSDADFYAGVDYLCRSCNGRFEHPQDGEVRSTDATKITWSEETAR